VCKNARYKCSRSKDASLNVLDLKDAWSKCAKCKDTTSKCARHYLLDQYKVLSSFYDQRCQGQSC
jgi:hypothetical protein